MSKIFLTLSIIFFFCAFADAQTLESDEETSKMKFATEMTNRFPVNLTDIQIDSMKWIADEFNKFCERFQPGIHMPTQKEYTALEDNYENQLYSVLTPEQMILQKNYETKEKIALKNDRNWRRKTQGARESLRLEVEQMRKDIMGPIIKTQRAKLETLLSDEEKNKIQQKKNVLIKSDADFILFIQTKIDENHKLLNLAIPAHNIANRYRVRRMMSDMQFKNQLLNSPDSIEYKKLEQKQNLVHQDLRALAYKHSKTIEIVLEEIRPEREAFTLKTAVLFDNFEKDSPFRQFYGKDIQYNSTESKDRYDTQTFQENFLLLK